MWLRRPATKGPFKLLKRVGSGNRHRTRKRARCCQSGHQQVIAGRPGEL